MATLEGDENEEVSLGFGGGEDNNSIGDIDMGFGLFGDDDEQEGFNDDASEAVSLGFDGGDGEANDAFDMYGGLGDEDTANMFGDEDYDYHNAGANEAGAGDLPVPAAAPAAVKSHGEINLKQFVARHVADVAKTEVPKVIVPDNTRWQDPVLVKFIRLHVAHAASSSVKVVDMPQDYTQEQIEHAFRCGRKEHLLNLLEYGIDIFAPLCIGSPEGKEGWLMDFYGTNEPIARDLLMADKDIVLKAYRKQKWKISLVGGSVAHWNRRRHFVAFLERYVINLKNQELRERARDIFSIVLVQSAIMAFL